MKVGFVGLGRMGYNMVGQLVKKHDVVVYDVDAKAVARRKGAKASTSLKNMVVQLPKHKIIWLMIPHQFVDATLKTLKPLLKRGDIIIDGGNSHYKRTLQRGNALKKKGIHFVDVGTSGGLLGAATGACFMAGGEKNAFKKVKPLLDAMAIKGGVGYMGARGAGHFVKMVHNGIEYGMMESIGEGFEILEKSNFKINHAEVARTWQHGSVIRAWLMDLVEQAFRKDPHLKIPSGRVGQTGEGLWTTQEAGKLKIPVPVIKAALSMRNRSQKCQRFSGKVVAMLRYGFGRHAFEKKKKAKGLKEC